VCIGGFMSPRAKLDQFMNFVITKWT